MLDIRKAREVAALELATRIPAALSSQEDASRSAWFVALSPIAVEDRDEFAQNAAIFLADFRRLYSWGKNPILADRRCGGDIDALQEHLKEERFNKSDLAVSLSGLGATALAYCLLIHSTELASQRPPANRILTPKDIADLTHNLPMVDACMSVGVDVSSKYVRWPKIADMHRAFKYADSTHAYYTYADSPHTYYTIGGGLEADYEMPQETYNTLLEQSLGFVSTAASSEGAPRRKITCYLGDQEVDKRMHVGLEAAGYEDRKLGDEKIDDDTYGREQLTRLVLSAA